MSDLDVVSSSSDLVSYPGLVVTEDGLTTLDSGAVSLAPSLANPTIHGLLTSPGGLINSDGIQIITINNPNEILNAGTDRWQLATIINVAEENGESKLEIPEEQSYTRVTPSSSDDSVLMPPPPVPQIAPLPPDAPDWARRIKCCEKIGDYYRGYVESDIELDLLLTIHKQQTHSMWGTRQSPSPAKPSTRLMWKSQYVPMDGIPFINTGSRAVVMECQYGPRRKGNNPNRKETNASGDYKLTCPARIYVKRVKKFPEYAVDLNQDKKMLKIEMDRAFTELKQREMSVIGQERYYVQLPTEKAHQFHETGPPPVVPPMFPQTPEVEQEPETAEKPIHRLDPRVAQKIREIVAGGETRVYAVRKQLRNFVTRDLYHGGNVPERHDLNLFPTVNDLKNHIHQALKDVENGTLPLTAPTVNVEIIGNENSEDSNEDQSVWLQDGANEPVPETVTVTLTQTPGDEGHHVISRIETHLSDGTTRVSTTLTPETAQLLSRLHPNMFPAGSLLQQQIDQAVTSISQKMLPETKTDDSSEGNIDETSFTTDDNFIPGFTASDSIISSFSSVSSLAMEGLSSEDTAQYTIDQLGSCDINSVCSSSSKSADNKMNTVSQGDESTSVEIKEENSETNCKKRKIDHLQIDPLESNIQSSDVSSEMTPLEINGVSSDMNGMLQIPYSVNGIQIIPLSGTTNLFSLPSQDGITFSSSSNTQSILKSESSISDIDNSNSIKDMQIDFVSESESEQLKQYSINDETEVSSVQSSQTELQEQTLEGNLTGS